MKLIKVKVCKKDSYQWKDISTRYGTNYSTESKVLPGAEYHCGTWNEKTVDTDLWLTKDFSLTSGDLKRMMSGMTTFDDRIKKETGRDAEEFRLMIPKILKELQNVAKEARAMMKQKGDLW